MGTKQIVLMNEGSTMWQEQIELLVATEWQAVVYPKLETVKDIYRFSYELETNYRQAGMDIVFADVQPTVLKICSDYSGAFKKVGDKTGSVKTFFKSEKGWKLI